MSNFWNFFLNILSLGLSSLSQIIYELLPGRMPINFFICIGTDPKKFEDIPRKIKKFIQFIGAICIVLYIALRIKLKIFSKANAFSPVNTPKQNGWILPPMQDMVEQNALASLGSLGFTLLCILPLWLIHLLFLTSPPEKLTLHPYQILIHFNHHGNRFVCYLWTIFLFLSKTNI